MAGDVTRVQADGFQNAPRSDRGCENCGLGLLGETKLVFRSLEAELAELVAERFVGFIESLLRYGIHGGKFFAHADGLRALTGEQECDRGETMLHECVP